MRILHLDSGRWMRGGQWQVLYLAKGLQARGHEVVLLARRRGELLKTAAAEGLKARPLAITSFSSLLKWAELIHAHDARTHTLAALAAVRCVVSRRVGFEVRQGPLSRWKYGGADHYIAISGFVARQLAAAGISSSIISVVYDGVELPADGAGWRQEGRVVAPLTEDPMKGSDLLREAARLAGVEVSFSSHLPADLPGARLFAYISRQEGLGSAALLAMAHGIPVVASRVGGLPEIVRDRENGILVENHPEGIAQGLRSLLDQPGLAARMGARGRELARDYTIEKMVDGTLRVYEKVLSNA